MSMFFKPAPLEKYNISIATPRSKAIISSLPAVKEKCKLLSFLFSIEPLQHIDKESLHVLHLLLSLDMFENAENQQFPAVFVSAKHKTLTIIEIKTSFI